MKQIKPRNQLIVSHSQCSSTDQTTNTKFFFFKQDEEFGLEIQGEAEGDSDYALSAMSTTKKSRKGRGSKHNTPSTSVVSDSGSGKFQIPVTYVLVFKTIIYFIATKALNDYY